MEVEILCRESIKPSFPTPRRLKTYKLCLLDQFRVHVFAPTFFYYPLNISVATKDEIDRIVSTRLQLLKQSLSETLVHFYPFAGKIVPENYSVDCSDQGVYFMEARAAVTLNEFLSHPELNGLINKLFPVDDGSRNEQMHATKVQVTSFDCGGLVICACISHFLGDATTLALFMKSWAATCTARTSSDELAETLTVKSPAFDASVLFPPYDAYPKNLNLVAHLARFRKDGRVVTRRFVFDAKAIADLKAKAAASPAVQNPSRVEAVSAILSKCSMTAFRKKSPGSGSALLTHTVNLRRRARPQLSENLVGNIINHANVICKSKKLELDGLVRQTREAITKLDGDFVKSLQGGEVGFANFSKGIEDEEQVYSEFQESITFTSYCGFGYYDIDFGWGKPIWISSCALVSLLATAYIVLMSTRTGDGVEAWVSLLEDAMNLLETDEELLPFATLDPTPSG